MAVLRTVAYAVIVLAVAIGGVPFETPHVHLRDRQQTANSNGPVVDLGYEVYQGVENTTAGIDYFLGMRYAASTEGINRWQAPKAPVPNRTTILVANAFPRRCPQGINYPGTIGYNGTEDCLFLSVFSPIKAATLPVLVWIHGGGYGQGQGNQDLTGIMQGNNNSFVGVVIQYRLAAFGFLSSEEVHRFGTPNAGILDQHFALQWVQKYIRRFGGDPSRVTISGESAGGGSVMLQAMAYGGTRGTSLFTNAIAASPYLPMQHGYADTVPSKWYYAFASTAGCPNNTKSGSQSVFRCLVSKDTAILQNASNYVTGTAPYGTWAFLPVTDRKFVRELPSIQLSQGRVNGLNMLVGNNANEGVNFVPQNILTEADFESYIRSLFPLFSNSDIVAILQAYPSTNASVNPTNPKYATAGDSGATAVNVSTFGTGQQQRANNLYAEVTFVCPSYWLAEAFSCHGRLSYKYQYSVVGAQHGADYPGYFGPKPANFGPAFEQAFMGIWGNFITSSNPSISPSLANGNNNPITAWPSYSSYRPVQIDLNQTGGSPYIDSSILGLNLTLYGEPGLSNDFRLVNAFTWEGGRGTRCDFWKRKGRVVPE